MLTPRRQVRNKMFEERFRAQSASAARRPVVQLSANVVQRLKDRGVSTAPGGPRRAAVLGIPPPTRRDMRARRAQTADGKKDGEDHGRISADETTTYRIWQSQYSADQLDESTVVF
jgi:hypothetical protein